MSPIRTQSRTRPRAAAATRPLPEEIAPAPAILLHSAEQLVTLAGPHGPRRGPTMQELAIIRDGAALIAGGKIVAVGTTRELMRHPWIKDNLYQVAELDCTGKIVTPGFVDSHTHPVFARPRLVDFEKRIAGATYEEIAEAGGGIRSSISGVRDASEKQLAELARAAFEEMAAHGTTTVEAKSGYGLNLDSEIKSLRAIRTAGRQWAGTVVPTLLGAHTTPPEYKANAAKYVDIVCNEMIPEVARKKLAQFVDVFCERGAFTMADSVRIFEAAAEHGLEVRAHVCQLSPAKLDPMLRFMPMSFDHLDCVDDQDTATLAEMDTIGTLVPAANFFLGVKYPPARKLIDGGVAVALATDYNPGTAPAVSMPFVMSIACTQMKMTPAEALTASTINGAYALGLGAQKGSIEPGKDADVAIFDVQDYREIAYWVGSNRCVATILNGDLQ